MLAVPTTFTPFGYLLTISVLTGLRGLVTNAMCPEPDGDYVDKDPWGLIRRDAAYANWDPIGFLPEDIEYWEE